MQSIYDVDAVKHMWEELKNIGVRSLTSPKEVDEILENHKGTTLLVVNSVCGCAAGHARPGVGLALQNKVIPDRSVTVFAGVDRDATERARDYVSDVPPSSPSVVLFKDGIPVYILHRSMIETSDVENVARKLITAFNEHCDASGPSVPFEVFENNFSQPQCSSTIPKNS